MTAPTEQGAFYGTRSLLQVLVQSPGRGSVPVGESVDWPDYASRGFMLDVGRRFFTPEFVRDYISMMSWFKLNEFQIHLMDNEISPAGGNWADAQAGFRLKSDNPAFAGLASTDGAYDRADWQSFEDTAAAHAVTIIPRSRAAHARSVVRWKPELGTNGGNSDHLDLSKPEATTVMKSIFSEFAPWFEGPDVHMGVDEYYASPALFRDYFNTMAAHVRSLGKHPAPGAASPRCTATPTATTVTSRSTPGTVAGTRSSRPTPTATGSSTPTTRRSTSCRSRTTTTATGSTTSGSIRPGRPT
ncbi:family 20 glycosylhydrolase [Oerskovia sp. M15]